VKNNTCAYVNKIRIHPVSRTGRPPADWARVKVTSPLVSVRGKN